MRERLVTALAVLIVFLGPAVVAVLTTRPPAPVAADAPAPQFSAQRALTHLTAIAQRPRPTGSAAHDEVRQYLVDQFRGLSIDVRVHTGAAVNDLGGSDLGGDNIKAGAELRSIVARIPGTAGTRPVALVTHYDSVAAGPGANDAGVPVSVLLETARALRAGPAPRNDVLFVFTDAEEQGLLGAKALTEDLAGLPDDAVILNFEARGSSGPALMFETGPDAAWLIDMLAEHSVRPQASSVFDEVYRYLPNLTDFTMFAADGHTGLNFAYIEGYPNYHGPHDSLANVSPETVQHQGEYAIGMATALAGMDLRAPPAGDSVYFTAGWFLVSYSDVLALPLAIGVLLLGGYLLFAARRTVSPRQAGFGVLVSIAHPVLACGLTFLVAPLVLSGHQSFSEYGDVSSNVMVLVTFGLLLVALSTVLVLTARRWVDLRHQAIGGIAVWTVLAVVTAVIVPGASYLFVWPVLGALLGMAVLRQDPLRVVAAAVLVLLPLAVLVVPMSVLVSSALGAGLVAAALALPALAVPLVLPVIAAVKAPRSFVVVPVGAAVVGVVLVVIVAVPASGTTDDRPTAYFLDSTSGSAVFLGGSAATRPSRDLWPAWTVPIARTQAPVAPLTPPTVDISRTSSGQLRISAASTRGARDIGFVLTGGSVRSYTVAGASLGQSSADEEPWELWVNAVPDKGVEIVLDVNFAPGMALRVADRTPGLPAGTSAPVHPPALGDTVLDNATLVSVTRSVE